MKRLILLMVLTLLTACSTVEVKAPVAQEQKLMQGEFVGVARPVGPLEERSEKPVKMTLKAKPLSDKRAELNGTLTYGGVTYSVEGELNQDFRAGYRPRAATPDSPLSAPFSARISRDGVLFANAYGSGVRNLSGASVGETYSLLLELNASKELLNLDLKKLEKSEKASK
ncbi:hypothetical protein HNR42_001514 [Deinobacterium chartae]|uniref:Lipoprotein n=1 Tax=Deinobacterium chartae TaxID=521158 RepID=A0A841I103_9DEIO|nr:hypothetical protein [Deinobacterium chartae]MBB6098089.1 hypothetical protein [Deinobacterium chartae]